MLSFSDLLLYACVGLLALAWLLQSARVAAGGPNLSRSLGLLGGEKDAWSGLNPLTSALLLLLSCFTA
jgi:hypothetical protein